MKPRNARAEKQQGPGAYDGGCPKHGSLMFLLQHRGGKKHFTRQREQNASRLHCVPLLMQTGHGGLSQALAF